ncbi:MAG: C1 family peptidase [Chloroflexota bacterium]
MEDQSLDVTLLQQALAQAGGLWEAGQTSLSGLSQTTKRLCLGANPPPEEASLDEREQAARMNFASGRDVHADAAPAAVDLRSLNGKNYITSVKNQLSCGSCVAFGSVATVEGTLRLKRNDPNLAVDLSEAHLFYCHAAAQGRTCNTGWWVDPALDTFKAIGVVDEACYPYTPGDQQCGVCTDWQNRVTRIASWTKLNTAADMKTWLSTRGPLAACFKVYEDFYAYRSGVYRHTSGQFLGGHCVTAIGYSDADGAWICKNSWGTGWGDGGFFRIAYGEAGIDYAMWGVDVAGAPAENWLNERLITGLWAINQDRNGAVYVDGLGWRKISSESDGIFLAILTVLSSAKSSKSKVNIRLEGDVIREAYVF